MASTSPLHLLFLLLLSALTSSSARLNPAILQYDAPNCSDFLIQLPFSFMLNSTYTSSLPRTGFEVFCNSTKLNDPRPMLSLGGRQYQLLNISLPEGYVWIAGRAITSNCNHNSTAPTKKDNSSPEKKKKDSSEDAIDLTGTPFVFSDKMNKFTATGCDAVVTGGGGGGDGSSNYSDVGGCVAFCPSPDIATNGSCTGFGCCQAPVPMGLRSLKHIQFTSIRDMTYHNKMDTVSASPKNCSKAFIVEKSWYSFSTGDLLGESALDEYRPVVLEWSIGNKSCDEVNKDDSDYACVDKNSRCNSTTSTGGYRCSCTEGYQGNPYVPDGCLDIDECGDPNKHDCVTPGICVNLSGNFSCTCPPGYDGDGRQKGTGCTSLNKRLVYFEIALGLGLGLLVILVGVGVLAYCGFRRMKRKKLKQKYFMQNGGLLLQQQIASCRAVARIFSSEELERATDKFNENRVLGHGGYGTVYKGILPDERVVAIKKSKFIDQNQIEQFVNEVIILSQINHRNVVKLLGCCLETEVPLLVYEFISNGTLSHHVHSSNTPLSWEHRLRIAVETAGALAYLHSATAIPIVHRDVKSANILLDENYNAKVSDFGASRLIPYDQTHVTTLVQGTLGYLDPEYFQTSVLTEKSDVYSFGVVLMELLTREKPISLGRSEEERNLASHFIMLLEEKRLLSVLDHMTVEEAGERQLLEVAHITRRCLNLRADDRPTMKEVAVELNALRRLLIQHAAQRRSKEDWRHRRPSSILCRYRTNCRLA